MDSFEQNKRLVEQRKKTNQERRQLYAKNRLETNVTKKITTTMIGALAAFEDFFGELWGIDLDEKELTKEQLEYREIWEDVRSEILSNGNMQIRAAQNEISEYTAEFRGKQIKWF